MPAARIMITTGSSGGFNLSFLGCFDPGARIAMASPGYPAYRNIIKALGLDAVEIPVGADTRWALTAEHVARADDTARIGGVLVASPANPTGTMTQPAVLADLVALCGERGIRFISDEIYHGLIYGEPAETALRFTDAAIIINSFSKYYCMTGWRIGWLVLPEDLVRPFERLSQSLYISVPELSQRAAIAAFDASAELEAVKAGYERNRAHLLSQAAGDRLRRDPAGGRRLLRLCLGEALHQRFPRVCRAAPGRGRRRGDAGHRLRPRAGGRLPPALLRRRGGGDRRGDRAAGGVAALR